MLQCCRAIGQRLSLVRWAQIPGYTTLLALSRGGNIDVPLNLTIITNLSEPRETCQPQASLQSGQPQ
jgi:hypothetical protein